MTFQICGRTGRRTALTSIQLITKSRAYSRTSLPVKSAGMSDLMQRLTNVWTGVKQNGTDDATGWLAAQTSPGHFEYSL